MSFDWTISLGNVLTIGGFAAAAVASYYATLRSVDARFSDIASKVDAQFAAMNLRLEKIFEGDIRELRSRILKLEEREDSLTKEVVDRTHKLAADVNLILLKVDRLERPRGISALEDSK